METKNIAQTLIEVTQEVGLSGIGKNDVNQIQKYKYRGIDAVYNTLNTIFGKCGLVIIENVTKFHTEERATKTGGTMITRIVEVEYKLLASDGSFEMAKSIGEANDTSDKAMNKAITAAYKYLMFQLFCIPLVGNEGDADNNTIEASSINEIAAKKQELQTIIDGYEYPIGWKNKAEAIIKDEKSTLTIIKNVISKLREEALKNVNNTN